MTGPTSSGLGSLRRIAARGRQPAAPEERCEFCAADIGERHGHVADVDEHRLLCVCRPCYLLFAPQGAGGGRYRGVGEDVRRVADLVLDDARWDSLRIPVDVVFFFHQSGAEHPLAFYPGPGGATESELDLRAWVDVIRENPVLGHLEERRRGGAAAAARRCVLLPPRADRRLLRAGRHRPALLDRTRWRPGGVAGDRGVLRRARRPGERRAPGRRRAVTGTDERRMNPAAGADGVPARRRRRRLHLHRGGRGPLRRRTDDRAQDAVPTERSGVRVHAVALRCQVRVEPLRRRYSDHEAARVVDLFGDRPRWGQTMQPLQLAFLAQVLPGFTGAARSTSRCRAATTSRSPPTSTSPGSRRATCRCCCCSAAGLHRRRRASISVEPVPWHKEAPVRLPVAVWREAMDAHFPEQAWLRLPPGDVRPARGVPRPSRPAGLGRRARPPARGESDGDPGR